MNRRIDELPKYRVFSAWLDEKGYYITKLLDDYYDLDYEYLLREFNALSPRKKRRRKGKR